LILIFYAFSREVSALKRRLRNSTPLNLKGLSGFRIRTERGEVAFVATGIGMRRARAIARQALSALPDTELVIGTGIVGALSGGLRPGDIVIADRAMKARADSSHPEHVVSIDPATLEHCERALHAAGLESSTGAILTSLRVIPNAAAKRAAKQHSGAIAVDMESAAIAIESAARGIPFAIVRTVVDSLEDEIFGAEIADEQGRVKPLAAANYLLRNPGAVLKIPWMIRNLALATRALADAIEALIYAGPS
jgi:adenosylhomocysteine nucleosidase